MQDRKTYPGEGARGYDQPGGASPCLRRHLSDTTPLPGPAAGGGVWSNNPEFNQGQPFQDMELEKTFDTAEVMVRFKCDVHPWMSAWLGVVDHPFFAVTGADGGFAIDNVPPGDYVLESWHETAGTKTQNVTVTDGGDVAISVDMSPAA